VLKTICSKTQSALLTMGVKTPEICDTTAWINHYLLHLVGNININVILKKYAIIGSNCSNSSLSLTVPFDVQRVKTSHTMKTVNTATCRSNILCKFMFNTHIQDTLKNPASSSTYAKDKIFLSYVLYRVIKNLCAPDVCTVIIRCTETFWSPCTTTVKKYYPMSDQ
jgi:hypothetical protein